MNWVSSQGFHQGILREPGNLAAGLCGPANVMQSADASEILIAGHWKMGDRELIRIVDAALAEAVRKSGPWLMCRPGCSECCIGPFPITQLDAARLRNGLAELQMSDPERAARVLERARTAAGRMPEFSASAFMEDEEFEARLAALPDDEPCPVLDPEMGTCDLYAARPVTCRIFGPPVRWGGDAVGVCELCFDGATDEEIAACEVTVEIADREAELEKITGTHGQTLVALALL